MEKEIPTKNYVILAVLILATVLAVFYARGWYNTTKEYNSQHSTMLTIVNEINQEEIANYTLENPKFILYVSSGQNANIKAFEKKFKKVVINKELSNSMLYLNSDGVNLEEFNKTLKEYAANDKLKSKIKNDGNVSMFIFENGKITNAIIDANNFSTKQLEKLLKKYGMIDNA